MPHHLTDEEIVQYNSGALLPAELLAADDHLAACSECRRRLALTPVLAEWAYSLRQEDQPASAHLDYRQLAAKVDRKLNADEVFQVEAHLRDCADCREELADLASFREQIQPRAAQHSNWRRSATWGAIAAALVISVGVWRYSAMHGTVGTGEPVLTASIRDAGGVIGLDSKGQLRAPSSVTAEDQILLLETLRRGALPRNGSGQEFASGDGSFLRGQTSEQAFVLIQPVGRVVLSDRPEFRWEGMNGAGRYKVEIFDTAFHRVANSSLLTGNSWTPEAPLKRGQTYIWQVTAERGGKTFRVPEPPAPEARFRVLDAEPAERLQRMAAQQPPSHLLLAAAYSQAGLKEEAQHELETLKRENPDSKLAAQLAEGR